MNSNSRLLNVWKRPVAIPNGYLDRQNNLYIRLEASKASAKKETVK
jgi:hypothetical protein